jgi:hypothetical protein
MRGSDADHSETVRDHLADASTAPLEAGEYRQIAQGTAPMTGGDNGPTPAERAGDLDRIGRALRAAVREALLQHKRDGDPVAVWRDGRVVWIQADDIPIPPDESDTADPRVAHNLK